VAWWEETRPVGQANVLTGLALIIVPFVLGFGTVALIHSIVAGVAVLALARVWGTYRPETFARTYAGDASYTLRCAVGQFPAQPR
jgi:hypothetical protein